MGTAYKGNALYFRSIGQNILSAASKYEYKNGRFGINSPSTGKFTRNIISSDPLRTAYDFYNRLSYGGVETIYDNGMRRTTQMADGTYISLRIASRSDGSPVVEINIVDSLHTGGIKSQKIHFVEG